jgi:glutamate 5-kinase
MTSADCLLLLSDVSGLYTADPNLDSSARLIPEIRDITPEIEAMGGGSASAVGSGGMATKIAAAKIATAAGCAMAIAAGAPLHPVSRLEEGADCSWFLPASNPENARKQWIAGSLRPSGAITIDAGALNALRSGKSLLPAGVIGVNGHFARGDTVSVLDRDGAEIARGMIAYNDRDAARILGKRSADIEALLGFRGRDEMIHRDDLVLLRADLAPA